MKTKILLIVFVLGMALSALSQQPANIGYKVVYAINGKTERPVKTQSLPEVYAIAETCMPGNCINFEKELQKNPFFDMGNFNRSFYVEIRRIKNGKFRRMSNRQFRAYTEAQRISSKITTAISTQP